MPELADIIPPLAPPAAPLPLAWIVITVAAVLFLLGLILWRARYRSRHRRLALKQIRLAYTRCQSHALNPRQALFAIAAALSRIYPATRAGKRWAPPASAEHEPAEEWSAFLRALDAARFAAPHPSAEQVAHLAAAAQQWIRRAPC